MGGYLLAADSGGSAATAQVTTRTVAVATGTVRASVSTTGTLSPADEKDVSFSSSGTVTSLRVSQGQRVKKGQLLATIDKVSLKATLAQDRASLASAKAQLAAAKDDSSSTSAQLSADKASVKTAKSSVAAAKKALKGARLKSPINGTVATVNVSKGDSVGSSDGSSGGNVSTASSSSDSSSSSGSSADFVIIGGKKWTVSASVDDTEVGLIKKGDQAQLTLDSSTAMVFGTVRSVSILASSSSSSSAASYPVDITVTGSPSGLHDGQSATVSIIYKQKTNVLTVSAAAVHSDGTSKYVYLDDNGTKVKRTVQTGLTGSDGTVEITSGLKAGDEVYVETVTLPRTTTGSSSTESGSNSGRFPGGSTGGFPGGGSGNFPGGGFGGN